MTWRIESGHKVGNGSVECVQDRDADGLGAFIAPGMAGWAGRDVDAGARRTTIADRAGQQLALEQGCVDAWS